MSRTPVLRLLPLPVTRAVALAAALAAGGCALPLVTESELATESGKAFEEMRASTPTSRDANLRRYITCVTDAIVAQLPEPYVSQDWTVEVFDEPDTINAFAMAGARVGIYTGLLKVAQDQDQLATVIGHEIAHVTKQHSLQRINRELTTQAGVVGVNAVLGGGAATGQVLSMGAQMGLSLPFSRGNETEADVEGLEYMAAAGFNPRASITLWQNMAKSNKLGPPQFLSTHPSDENRIQDLIRQLPPALKLYNEAQAAGRKPNCQR
jgi:predicted Zn-dependent protease